MPPALQLVPKPLNAMTLEELADCYGVLDLKVQHFDPVAEEHKLYEKELQRRHDEHPADLPAVVKGKRFTIQLGARRNERTITDQKKAFTLLRAAVGSLDGAIALVSIPLTAAIDKFIPEAKQKQCIKQERTGYRTVKAVLNGI